MAQLYAVYNKVTKALVSVGEVTDPTIIANSNINFNSVPIAQIPDSSLQWDVATLSFIPATPLKIQIEVVSLQPMYERWLRWKTSLTEAQNRALAANVITALSNQVETAWNDYKNAVLQWYAAQ